MSLITIEEVLPTGERWEEDRILYLPESPIVPTETDLNLRHAPIVAALNAKCQSAPFETLSAGLPLQDPAGRSDSSRAVPSPYCIHRFSTAVSPSSTLTALSFLALLNVLHEYACVRFVARLVSTALAALC